jgi:hypothetical protein
MTPPVLLVSHAKSLSRVRLKERETDVFWYIPGFNVENQRKEFRDEISCPVSKSF